MRDTLEGSTISWIKADLHVHSYVSDGEMDPRDIVRLAKRKGLSAISITDHNTFLGSYVALKKGFEEGVVLVPGAEFRTEHGDILVLCGSLPIDSALELKLRNRGLEYIKLSSLLELAARENCVTVAVHPFAVSREGCGRLFELKHLNCVEVYNSSSDTVTNLYTIHTASFKDCKTAGSDAHIPELVGSAYTLVEIKDLNAEEIVEGIRKSRVKPHYDAALDLLKSLGLVKHRVTHSIRVGLGIYGDPWKRAHSYPI
ncbi:MAG: CehA/McbA family metallohydrolase [Sulfolobales archaeon]|nr:CehA/McbA family metallohydrolase [Sulfolobales archaeon]MDW8083416.1 CehA/McbA family metallohydrolase [Sulfolobales archaeon]